MTLSPSAVAAAGPTVLEVFNTLLRQLRQSVDYQLTGYYDNAGKHKTTSCEEETLQHAVIMTIGQNPFVSVIIYRQACFVFMMAAVSSQDPSPTRFLSTKGQRSCSSSWGRSPSPASTPPWALPTPGTAHSRSVCRPVVIM